MKRKCFSFCLITLLSLNLLGCEFANDAGQAIKNQEQKTFEDSLRSIS